MIFPSNCLLINGTLTVVFVGMLLVPCEAQSGIHIHDVFREVEETLPMMTFIPSRLQVAVELGVLYAKHRMKDKAWETFLYIDKTLSLQDFKNPYVGKIQLKIDTLLRMAESVGNFDNTQEGRPFLGKGLDMWEKEKDGTAKFSLGYRLFVFYLKHQQWQKAKNIITNTMEVIEGFIVPPLDKRIYRINLLIVYANLALDNGNASIARLQIPQTKQEIERGKWFGFLPDLARLEARFGHAIKALESIERAFDFRSQRLPPKKNSDYQGAYNEIVIMKVIDLCSVAKAHKLVGDAASAEHAFEVAWEIYENVIDPMSYLGNVEIRLSHAAAVLGKWDLALSLYRKHYFDSQHDDEVLSEIFNSLKKAGQSSKTMELIDGPRALAIWIQTQKPINKQEKVKIKPLLMKWVDLDGIDSSYFRAIFYAKSLIEERTSLAKYLENIESPFIRASALLGVADGLLEKP